jgi:hypothetical protein
MRKYFRFIVAIGLVASPSAWAGSLALGKPAGVRQAAMTTGAWVVAGGLGAIGIAVIAVAVSGSNNGASSQSSASGSSTTTTTTTTTTTA